MNGDRATGSGTRILLADESRHSRGLLAFLLRVNGYEVVEASNGREALSALLNHPFDAGIIEGFLPGMTGFEVCSTLKLNARTRPTPLVLMAAAVDSLGRDEDTLRRVSSADEFLLKPFTIRELLDCIEKVLGSRTPQNV